MRRKVFFLSWLGKYCKIESSRVDCLDLEEVLLGKNIKLNKDQKHTIVSFSIVSELAKDRL